MTAERRLFVEAQKARLADELLRKWLPADDEVLWRAGLADGLRLLLEQDASFRNGPKEGLVADLRDMLSQQPRAWLANLGSALQTRATRPAEADLAEPSSHAFSLIRVVRFIPAVQVYEWDASPLKVVVLARTAWRRLRERFMKEGA